MSDLPKTTKIHDLPKVSEVNDSDIFIIQSDENTNKIDGADLKAVMQKQAITATYDHTSDNEIHVTKTEKELWNSMSGGGSDFFVTKEELEEAMAYENESVADVTNVKEALDTIFDGGTDVDISALTTNIISPTITTTTKGGITLTDNCDGTYTLSGTATSDQTFNLALFNCAKSGKYKLVGCPKNGSADTYQLCITAKSVYDFGEGVISDFVEGEKYTISIKVTTNTTISDLVFKPMITTNQSATYNDFVPYTGNTGKLNGDLAEIRKTYFSPHNKPTGTYTGNGNATNRTVSVGGIGKAILVRPIGTKNFAVVTESGYTGKLNGSPVVGEDVLVLNSGDLWIQSDSSLFNTSGASYYYEKL